MGLKDSERKSVWEQAIRVAVKHGFDIEKWMKDYDTMTATLIAMQSEREKKSFFECVIPQLTYVRTKAIVFSHEFANAFYPKTKCTDVECTVCKDLGGHESHIFHMKNMCEYIDFTAYLEITMDDDEREDA